MINEYVVIQLYNITVYFFFLQKQEQINLFLKEWEFFFHMHALIWFLRDFFPPYFQSLAGMFPKSSIIKNSEDRHNQERTFWLVLMNSPRMCFYEGIHCFFQEIQPYISTPVASPVVGWISIQCGFFAFLKMIFSLRINKQ